MKHFGSTLSTHIAMQALHARMQPLLLFFIDAANLIESKEPEWDLLLAMRTKGGDVTVVGSQIFRRKQILLSSIALNPRASKGSQALQGIAVHTCPGSRIACWKTATPLMKSKKGAGMRVS